MELHGSTRDNLVAALRSARRLRGHAVYSDTLSHWGNLLHHARRELTARDNSRAVGVEQLLRDLEWELAQRTADAAPAPPEATSLRSRD